MSTTRIRILRCVSAAGAIASAAALAAPAGNLVVTVPGDYPTIQQAVDAVQGIVEAEVLIASDAIFDETVEIGATVALRAAPGFTPSLRGVGASGLRTLRFRPNGGVGDDPIDLTIAGLTLLPRSGLAPGAAYTVLEIENDGQAESRVFLDHVRFADPLGGAPDGLSLRSVDPAVPNQLHVLASMIELAGGPGSSTRAISLNTHGTAVLSGLDLAIGSGTATGLDIRSPAGGDLDFWLEDATISLAAPADNHSAEALVLSDRVHATLRDNLFLLADTAGAGGVSGVQALTSSTLSLVLERNRFVGSDFASLGAALLASAFSPGVADLRVSNNVVTGVGVGFVLNPQSGSPPATLTGSFVGNTVDGTVDDAILLAGQSGSRLELTIADNLLTHAGRFGLEVASIGTVDLDEHHDGYFANPLGDVSAPFSPARERATRTRSTSIAPGATSVSRAPRRCSTPGTTARRRIRPTTPPEPTARWDPASTSGATKPTSPARRRSPPATSAATARTAGWRSTACGARASTRATTTGSGCRSTSVAPARSAACAAS